MKKTEQPKSKEIERFKEVAKKIRKQILEIIYKAKAPHIGSSFSIVEVLVSLYFKYLNISPDNPQDENRDRFILSKGHGCPALYSVLGHRGFLSQDVIEKFACNNGELEVHPTFDLAKGIEVSTGSLGHGLSVGAGMALAGKVDNKHHKIYVLLSDGELNEGSVWEAVMFAAHHKLNNLVAFIDCNRIQALGYTKDIINLEPIGDKWKSFGWHVKEIDGHSFEETFESLNTLSMDKPNLIVLHTVKGKGVSFMENELLWHYRTPDDEEYKNALKEI